MVKRIITGAGLVAVVTGFFFLRKLTPACFEILIWLFALLGSFEVARAMGSRITALQKWSAVICAAAFAPVFYAFGFSGALCVAVLSVMWQLALAVFDHANVTLEGVGLAVLTVFYPALLLTFMSAVNLSGQNSTVALLLIFIISPFADTFAFFVGSALKGRKLCPSVSPNKTVSGAIGGVLGGIIGSLAVYFIFGYGLKQSLPAWWFFLIAGVVGSVLTEFGDLVESVVKRKAGIKDMGNILPGHGGIMDRIDGILFAAPFIYFCFNLLTLL